MPPDKVATARQMYESKNYTIEAIAKVLGVSRASIYRHLADGPPSPTAERSSLLRLRRHYLGRRHLGSQSRGLVRLAAEVVERVDYGRFPDALSGTGWAGGVT